MPSADNRELAREIISTCRYLTLSTCDGAEPWATPIEFLCDDELNFYFLSTVDCLHARHIDANPTVAIAIYDVEQPAYSPGATTPLRGLQVRGSASRLAAEEYPDTVVAAVEALKPPMPPYAVFQVKPLEFFLPKLVNGVNERVAVQMR